MKKNDELEILYSHVNQNLKRRIIDYFIQKNTEQLSKNSNAQNDFLCQVQDLHWQPKKLKLYNEVHLDPLEGNNPYYEQDPGIRIGI